MVGEMQSLLTYCIKTGRALSKMKRIKSAETVSHQGSET